MRRTVLVVDDEPMVTATIRRMLEPEGWDVLAAGDGIGALDLLATLTVPPHLVITDMRMPGMGGMELARRLHAQNPGLPILCISGYPDEPMPEFCDALAKPFNSEDLIAKANTLVRRQAMPVEDVERQRLE